MPDGALPVFDVALATFLLQAAGNFVIAALLLRLHRAYPRRYLADWGWSWLALGAYHATTGAAFALAAADAAGGLRTAASTASLVLAGAQLAWLAQGARDLATGRRLAKPAFRLLLGALAAIAVVATLATTTVPPELRLFVRVGVRSLAAAIVLVAAAWAVRRTARGEPGVGPRLLMGAFLLYGCDQLHYFAILAAGLAGLRPASLFPYSAMVDFLLQMAIGLGMTVWLLEDEQREIRRTGRQLAHDQHHLRLLFEQMPVIVWSVDRELRIDSCAGSGLRALGVGPGEVVGLHVGEFLAAQPKTAAATEKVHRSAFAGYSASFDQAFRGREFHVLLEPLRDADGAIVGCVGVAIDVTEQRRLEASYPETQRLESLGVLAGGIAHDLNNLLTGVLGHAELAQRQLPADSPAAPDLERSVQGVLRCGELAHQLLAYAGRAEARRDLIDLAGLVRGMGDLLRVSIGPRCSVRYEFADPLPLVDADAAQLRQIVMNLITNGAEAIGDSGGTLTVNAATRDFDAAELTGFQFGEQLPAGDYVVLRVADTGAGMTPTVAARIFEPFYSTKRTGRGLGLAAVLGIVREHGGALRVDSAPGRGTTFELLFPPARQSAQLTS